jgi:hypothetical protein
MQEVAVGWDVGRNSCGNVGEGDFWERDGKIILK